jgi:hypothetical protein
MPLYQRDGTAVSSLAREQLLEAEVLNGLEYHVQEDVVKRVLGSMFQGKSFYPI